MLAFPLEFLFQSCLGHFLPAYHLCNGRYKPTRPLGTGSGFLLT
ncbi:rCG22809 [Rattus norvegicus]|uniref:RCG22809 n=1 Tax=Rattus norvegicus TaxID=10116 RepID=A6JYE9_RAT|nr:rCG22809 [Rattus norvegicus]